MQIIKLALNDRVVMKKKHPCGQDTFRVLRLGSDIRIQCEGCGRDMTLPREKLERAIKCVLNISSE